MAFFCPNIPRVCLHVCATLFPPWEMAFSPLSILFVLQQSFHIWPVLRSLCQSVKTSFLFPQSLDLSRPEIPCCVSIHVCLFWKGRLHLILPVSTMPMSDQGSAFTCELPTSLTATHGKKYVLRLDSLYLHMRVCVHTHMKRKFHRIKSMRACHALSYFSVLVILFVIKRVLAEAYQIYLPT